MTDIDSRVQRQLQENFESYRLTSHILPQEYITDIFWTFDLCFLPTIHVLLSNFSVCFLLTIQPYGNKSAC